MARGDSIILPRTERNRKGVQPEAERAREEVLCEEGIEVKLSQCR